MRKLSLFVGLMLAGTAQAAPQAYDQPYDQPGYGVATLDERVSKLEKRLSSNALVDLANRVESLQAEVLKLRGTVEELNHELDRAKKQQRDQYNDLDQRMQRAATPPPPPPAATTPPAVTPPPEGQAVPPGPAGAAVTTPPPVAPPPPVVDPAARRTAYEKAFNTLKEGKYSEAIKEFKTYTAAYPSGENTDSAYYWLAEAYYVNRDFNAARDNFRKVAKEFPQSTKVPDAHLKLGFIEYENGQYAAAKDLLTEVTKRYPDSSAAKMAEKRLERMRQEKR